MTSERRRFLRFPCDLPVFDETENVQLGRATDISMGGMCIEGGDFKIKQYISSHVSLPFGKTSLKGKVVNVRKDGKNLFGVEFSFLNGLTDSLKPYLSLQYRVEGPYSSQSNAGFSMESINNYFQNVRSNDEIANWIKSVDIGDELLALSDRYDLLGDRDKIIWQWGCLASRLTTLEGVSDVEHVCKTKVATIMLNGLLDDLVDKFHDRDSCDLAHDLLIRNRPLNEVSNLKCKKDGSGYMKLISDVWKHIHSRLCGYPNYEILKPILIFDYEQLFNSMRYACLANTFPSYANMTEYFLYQPHNMNVMINSTIDLMNNKNLDVSELGRIREIAWVAQKLARIANALSTWKREIKENDFSSAVFAYLWDEGKIESSDIENSSTSNIGEKVVQSGCEKVFFDQWMNTYHEILNLVKKTSVKSVEMNSYAASMPRLFFDLHLNLEGYI